MTQAPPSAAPLTIRRNAEIYETDGGWFHARWHFSFDQYYDPENMNVGLLRVFNHDTLRPGAVWPMHPHRDVEGITYVASGEFEHADNLKPGPLGSGGVLHAGGVQRMTLGSGALHSERNHSQTEAIQFIQMWIMPSQRSLEPSVEQRQYEKAEFRNQLFRFLKPEGVSGAGVMVHQDVSMYASMLDPKAKVEHAFPQERGGYLYLVEGAIEANDAHMTTGDAAKVLAAGALRIVARSASELLLVDTPLPR